MSLMNGMKKLFPMQQVDAKALEQKVEKKEISTVYKKETQEERMENGEYEILEREIFPEKIICPDCGGITWEGLDFCDKCGGDLRNL